MGIEVLIYIAIFVLIAVGIYGTIHSSHDHYSKNADLKKDAQIVDMATKQYNKYKFETTVQFSDGFKYVSYLTKKEDYGFKYRISVGKEEKIKIAEKAIAKHAELIEKNISK